MLTKHAGESDGLTETGALGVAVGAWRDFLEAGLDEDMLETIRSGERTGRPLGDAAFVARLEAATGRDLARRKPGPKPAVRGRPQQAGEINIVSPELRDRTIYGCMMMDKILVRFILTTTLSLVLGSCFARAGVNINDLTLVSVERPDPKTIDKSEPDMSNDIVINLSNARDLRGIAEKYEFNIGIDVYFCPDGKIDTSMPLQANPYIFDSLGKLDAFGKRTSSDKAERENYYHVFVSIKSVKLAGQTVFPYSLETKAEAICIRLHGGNMLGEKFTSNVISVSKENIISALTSR